VVQETLAYLLLGANLQVSHWRRKLEVGVGCGHTDFHAVEVFLGVTPVYPYVVGPQCFPAPLNSVR